MKKIIYLIASVALLWSCSNDFLDRNPVTQKVVDNYYKTTTDAEQALTAVYNVLTWDDYDGFIVLSEIASDNCFGGGGATDGDGLVRYDRFVNQTGSSANKSMWTNCYTGIYRANVLLQNLGNIDWKGDTTLRNTYESEARFLRAYFNFNLTRMFGKVPLLEKPATPSDVFTVASAEDIYTSIVNDLKYASSHLASTTYSNISTSSYGHATKWAAESLLGRVFLYYTGYYGKSAVGSVCTASQAYGYIKDVINNSGHALVDTFSRLWVVPAASTGHSYAGEGNKETVFAIKYTIVNQSNSAYGASWWERMIGPRSYNVAPYGQGWGAAPVNPSLYNAFDSKDSRKKASILSWTDEGRTYDNAADQRQYTGYNIKKYEMYCQVNGHPYDVTLGSTDWQFDGYEDYMAIRFADVLLMGSELALLNNDPDGKAQVWFNTVRNRAFLPNVAPTVNVSKSSIMDERRFEFAFEGIRYWDLLRTSGLGGSNPTTAMLKAALDNESSSSKFYVNGQNAINVKGLFQVPASEISLMNMKSSDFEQNALYDQNTNLGPSY